MKDKTTITKKTAAAKQPGTPSKYEGLLGEIVEDFLKSLRASGRIEDSLIKSLEELASTGKLNDLEAIQSALRTPPANSANASS
jgi:hypothetical protein